MLTVTQLLVGTFSFMFIDYIKVAVQSLSPSFYFVKNILLCAFIIFVIYSAAISQQPSALDIELKNYPYPYPVKFFNLNIQKQNLQMAYMYVVPSNPNGETVTLFHGKNFCGAYWERVIKDLAASGYTVVVPDQIGFGKSSKPESFQYSLHQLAQNTKSLLDSLNVRQTNVIGHSMGGMLATRFALMYKDMVPKLVLEDPIGLEDWKRKVPYQSIDQWYQREMKSTEQSIREYQKKNYYHGEWKAEYEPWVQLLYRLTLSPDYPRIAWNSALTYDMVFTQPVLYEFPDVRAKTLLIIGQLDRTAIGKDLVSKEVEETMGNYPELGRAAAAAIPNAKLIPLAGVGHVPHLEAYDSFWKAVYDFLKS
jgi:pimeloyl-ACP methyl ester carboxylesterase